MPVWKCPQAREVPHPCDLQLLQHLPLSQVGNAEGWVPCSMSSIQAPRNPKHMEPTSVSRSFQAWAPSHKAGSVTHLRLSKPTEAPCQPPYSPGHLSGLGTYPHLCSRHGFPERKEAVRSSHFLEDHTSLSSLNCQCFDVPPSPLPPSNSLSNILLRGRYLRERDEEPLEVS